MITIYTDGASRGNPGPGGYGVVLLYQQHRKELSAGYRLTTNNRMELLAVITGLEALKNPGQSVKIFSDSKYVIDAVEKGWLLGWVKKNFKDKKNEDLWRRYLRVASKHAVSFQWVRGHAGNTENERCDVLATTAADAPNLPPDIGYEEGM
ncbi:MAG: ribonuclease HI [Cytophagaceae bacterium]|jgi:ribonuclease HI|nr:ribonuclease HI [Cytophagaceae bacterium]